MAYFERLFRNPFFRTFMIIYVIFVVIFIIYFYIFRGQRESLYLNRATNEELINIRKDFKELRDIVLPQEKEMSLLGMRICELEKRTPPTPEDVKNLMNSIKGLDPAFIKNLQSVFNQINEFRKKVDTISIDISNLKKALNPTNPEDILAVARLGDRFDIMRLEIEQVRKEISDLKGSVDAEVKQNYLQVDKQIDRIVEMMKWLLLLLIPLVLSTIRDLLKPRASEVSKQ